MKKKEEEDEEEMLMEGRSYSFISYDENGLKMLSLLNGGWCKWDFKIVWN